MIWPDRDLQWSGLASGKRGRRQKRLRVRIPYRPVAQGLHLLVDSTGLKMMGEGEWKRKKHIGIDAQTLEIRAIEVTPNSVGGAPVLASLLGQIDPNEALLSVSGDGAYDTKACHEAIALHQAQAIIPVRKNAR